MKPDWYNECVSERTIDLPEELTPHSFTHRQTEHLPLCLGEGVKGSAASCSRYHVGLIMGEGELDLRPCASMRDEQTTRRRQQAFSQRERRLLP